MKYVIYIVIAAAIIFGVYYYLMPSSTVQQNQNQTPETSMPTVNSTTTVTTTTSNNTPLTFKTYNISVSNYSFVPNTMSINKGDTIIWTNNDSVPHQIKGDKLSSLSGPVMSNGQTYSYTFTDAGTFGYHCNIHPSMKGTITVK